jgi:hypothetical protein
MTKKEDVLAAATLSCVLPVLSQSVVETLTLDLERAVKKLGKRRDNGLRQVAVAMRSFLSEAKERQERVESEFTIDTR